MVLADFAAILALHNERLGVLIRKSDLHHNAKTFVHHTEQSILDEIDAVQNVIGTALNYVKSSTNPDGDVLDRILEMISKSLNALNVRLNERILAAYN